MVRKLAATVVPRAFKLTDVTAEHANSRINKLLEHGKFYYTYGLTFSQVRVSRVMSWGHHHFQS